MLWCNHAFDLFRFALVIMEDDLYAGARVGLLSPNTSHPDCTRPQRTGDIFYVYSVQGVLARRMSEQDDQESPSKSRNQTHKAFIGFFM